MDMTGPYAVYGANGQIGRHSSYNHENSELLLGCRGSVGQVHESEPKSWITSNSMVVRPDSRRIERAYLRHVLAAADLRMAISGTAQPQITRASLASISVALPSLDEQKRIVAILDEAFEGIAKATTNAEKNLANAQELFSSYRRIQFADSGLEFSPLEAVCENLDSKRVPITKKDREPGEIPYYGASGIVDQVAGWIFNEDILLVSEDGANLLMRTYPIAFSVKGKCWVNNHAHVLRFSEPALQNLIEYYLNSISLERWVSGMAQPKLNQKALNSIPVPTASPKECEEIVSKLDAVATVTKQAAEAYEQKIATLSELKQSLLHKAFSGQLTSADTIAA